MPSAAGSRFSLTHSFFLSGKHSCESRRTRGMVPASKRTLMFQEGAAKMVINASAYDASNAGLTRLPTLGGTVLQFDLPQEIARLRNGESWLRSSGCSSRTPVKYPDLHVVLIVMKAGTGLGQHHGDGRISIQLFEGGVRLQIAEQSVEMKAGAPLTLEYGTPHNVEAIEDSALLITISWPGGTKDERHARYVP